MVRADSAQPDNTGRGQTQTSGSNRKRDGTCSDSRNFTEKGGGNSSGVMTKTPSSLHDLCVWLMNEIGFGGNVHLFTLRLL